MASWLNGPNFARRCEEEGIVFIGPPSHVIAELGDKTIARRTVRGSGVPVIPGMDRPESDPEILAREAAEIGYPVLIKAAAGGGGKGMRVAGNDLVLKTAFVQAQAEAKAAFGNAGVYVEKFIERPRHIEVQVLADLHGNAVHLWERDCSTQRRHQKLIEESPAPNLPADKRKSMCEAAVRLIQSAGYTNAGTVEFILDQNHNFYFIEVNARIQVEHPVTEMATGVDIVREQIRIAAGLPLSLAQADVTMRGSAIQCRINAEDPWNHYLPSPGVLRRFRMPGGAHLRVDTYGCAGCEVPVEYDPILATVVVWGDDRDLAVRRTTRALDEFTIRGVQTNLTLLRQIVGDARFAGGVYDTSLLGQLDAVQPPSGRAERDLAAAAAVAYVLRNQAQAPVIPERTLSGWHRSSRALS